MIFEFSNFMSPKLCDEVIKYFNCSPKKDENNLFYSGRTLDPHTICDSDIRLELKSFLYKVTQESYKKYNQFIFPEYWNIVSWETGMFMDPHVDNSIPIFVNRHYTSICYLNDDFSGGETILPKHHYTCKPEKGKVLIFPSEYLHGVNLIENKTRYTLVMWFTKNYKSMLEY